MFFLFKCNSYSKLDFSESASSNFDGIYLFNSNLLFIIINIVLFVWWILIVISLNFFDFISFEKKILHIIITLKLFGQLYQH